jgi:uncharacterized protein
VLGLETYDERSLVVVSNSSPLILAAQIGQLELVRLVYGQILIPDAVYQEIVIQGAGLAGGKQVRSANWIQRKSVADPGTIIRFQSEIDKGESEAIALSVQVKADVLLMDERRGRIIAAREGLKVTGIVGVLIRAKQKSHISLLKPVLDDLFRNTKFRGSRELYQQALQLAGE